MSLGTRHGGHGERTSALVFDSADRLSPLRKGRGYWRYIPTDDGVRFLTGYDYEPGWGALGRALDPLVVRPFVWWLTARSFDRLRLWAEAGVAPEQTSLWRAMRPGRRPRARARRCLSRPPQRGRGVMQDAPASLAEIAQ
ncbi:SRPBCC family protein [Microbacterium sp. 22242]|uniref:SRPBCC family protein n=1 Tax=Microbacterium sp. 22242 TaxID=3453896 RepID=UPI003F850500